MKYVLAPLAGFTDAPFRRLCREGGADLSYTEMVSAAGLSHGSSPTRHLMETMPGEGDVGLQLFGSKEIELAHSLRELGDEVTGRFCEVNLNAGCPMTKITREGAGAKLVEDPQKVYRLLKAMAENTSLPVTLKTRLGPRPGCVNIFELVDAARSAGAKGVIVHARYTSQMHGGQVALETLAEVVSRTSLPVTGNGSVVDMKSASEMEKTGVKAIMVGRAALSNPFVFSLFRSRSAAIPDKIEMCERHLKYIVEFRERLAAAFPGDRIPSLDGYTSVKMHTHLFRYFGGRPGAASLRARLNTVRTYSEIREIVDSCKSRMAG